VSEPKSWIQQVRLRLAERPARQPLVAESARRTVLMPLLVDAGELWTALLSPAGEPPTFPGGPLAPGEDAWETALAAAARMLSIESRLVLRLGELEEVEDADGGLVTPCVGALPAGLELAPGEGFEEVVRLPLTAFAGARLVEQRTVDTPAGPRQVRAYHVGRHTVWGTPAHLLEDLLERLGG
jgi:hypothetical protein